MAFVQSLTAMVAHQLFSSKGNSVMHDKILSIIVPSYNMEAYLPKCLGSLVVDDKDLLQKLDVIVVNDGSKDRTSEIAHEFEAKFPGVFRVIDKTNGHYGSCINAALAVSKGVFVKVLDADDVFDKLGFSILIKALKASEDGHEHIDLMLTPYVTVDVCGSCKYLRSLVLDEDSVHDFCELLPIATDIFMHSITYRTEKLRNIGYHQTEGISYTDTEWCFLPMTAVRKFRYLNTTVYRYSLGRDEQSVSKKSTITNFRAGVYGTLVRNLISSYQHSNADADHRSYLFAQLKRLISTIYFDLVFWVPIKEAIVLFDALDEIVKLVPDVFHSVETVTISNTFKWHYVRFFRNHRRTRRLYLVQLRIYFWVREFLHRRMGVS